MESKDPTTVQQGPPAPPPSQQPKQGLGAGRIIAIVTGSVVAIIGMILVLLGALFMLAHSGRGDDGYYTSGSERLVSARHAITVEDIDLGDEASSAIPRELLGRIRITAERADGGKVFVGIGPEREVDAYLSKVGYDKVDDLDPPRYLAHPGGRPDGPPAAQRFWTASSEGNGRRAAEWEIEGGRWTVVAMNADGSRRVTVDADVGAKPEWFQGAGIGLLIGGVLLMGGGVLMIVLAARRKSRA